MGAGAVAAGETLRSEALGAHKSSWELSYFNRITVV